MLDKPSRGGNNNDSNPKEHLINNTLQQAVAERNLPGIKAVASKADDRGDRAGEESKVSEQETHSPGDDVNGMNQIEHSGATPHNSPNTLHRLKDTLGEIFLSGFLA